MDAGARRLGGFGPCFAAGRDGPRSVDGLVPRRRARAPERTVVRVEIPRRCPACVAGCLTVVVGGRPRGAGSGQRATVRAAGQRLHLDRDRSCTAPERPDFSPTRHWAAMRGHRGAPTGKDSVKPPRVATRGRMPTRPGGHPLGRAAERNPPRQPAGDQRGQLHQRGLAGPGDHAIQGLSVRS